MQAITPTQFAPGTRSQIHTTHHVSGITLREKRWLEG
jgi:hypothetical protein